MPSIRQVRKQIGETIRELRRAAGFSQEKLAEKADLHPVYLGQVERGEKAVSVEAVWKISKALKVDMAKIFEKAGAS